MGLKIGKDIHLVGCNNSESLLFNLHPRPVTIDINPHAVGRRAIEQLDWRLLNPNEPLQSILLTPVLVKK